MNELQTILNNILTDKNANLLPENLKAGVTCLGVTGNFEGGEVPTNVIEKLQTIYYGFAYDIPTPVTISGQYHSYTFSKLPFDPNEHPCYAFCDTSDHGFQIKVLTAKDAKFTGDADKLYTKYQSDYVSYSVSGDDSFSIDDSGSLSAGQLVFIYGNNMLFTDLSYNTEVSSISSYTTQEKYDEISKFVYNYKLCNKYGNPLASVEELLDAIITDKNTNLIPDNIKKDIIILSVTGTYNPEVKLNIYAQETEPETKQGLWLKSNVEYDSVISDTNVTLDPYWNTDKMSGLKAIPYNFYGGSVSSVGTDIYLFGSNSRDYDTTAYKYDTTTDIYTVLTNIPYNFCDGSAASVGTDVYLFGGYSSETTAYKYNTLTDTYTQLTNIPYQFYVGSAVLMGTNIYLFGSFYGKNTAYKYDTTTDTYTQLANIPYDFYNGSAVSMGTDVYLFGSGSGDYFATAYKYDTTTDAYTQLTNIPYQFSSGSAVSMGTDVYLFGSGSVDYSAIAYKYDTTTDTYTALTNIPYNFREGSAVSVGTDIYLLAGGANPTKVQVFTFPVKDYTDKSIVIQTSPKTKETNLITTDVVNGLPYGFNNFYYYTTAGGLDKAIEKYYGDGTTWNKIS